jgi:hypothetical protein
MQHWTAGDGLLEIQHGGKIYSGEINAEGIRRIRGERQRFPGWIATPVLVAADGDKIICDLKWGRGKLPAGSCKDADGAKFDVRFE